mmetsp:Transcript_80857/g.142624  ORF Transcript_80857/g.142624 Transcript_80857/m.142624 type:complete len:462 (+) Transcript_80857:94-1479(+)|eukprot:CAMPEP_0197641550 /NCGR_PEP_ID=MMETSP1338-20131121/15486_1 /TAXON_ID=43686 ORGANISM="Pelagodinium beii, Strain RCC1491" /NCGR_SAMPLE_ID=MMETSP1338 /ASSEMBLY_ACC=CAM_ASM_000754 /LENGTH=461 /DNA_ID=CAMNT_0043214555 /DNA_START=30 /DNA_END=1415 /DNA_ORIENTATION=+
MAVSEKTPLIKSGFQQPAIRPVVLARTVTLFGALIEGWDGAVWGLTLAPITAEFGLRISDIGMFAALPHLLGPLGMILAGILMDRHGRKRALIASYVCCAAGLGIVASAISFRQLLFGRVVMALGFNAGTTAASVYLAELSPCNYRGSIVASEEILLSTGKAASTICWYALQSSEYGSWRPFLGLAALSPCIAILGLLILPVPESPRYLLMAGRTDEALEVMMSIEPCNQKDTVDALQLWQREEEAVRLSSSAPGGRLCELFQERGFWLSAGTWFFKECSGQIVITNLMIYILSARGMSEQLATLWFTFAAVLRTLALLLPVFYFIDKVGRRVSLMASAILCSLCMAAAASVTRMKHHSGILLALSFTGFMASFSLGYGPVAWVSSELLPNAHRGKAFALSRVPSALVSSFIVLVSPSLVYSSPATLYFTLSAINLAAMLFFTTIPETTRMTLEQVRKAVR